MKTICRHRPRRKRTLGTSMIELLVVIVVFLVGILAVLQVFPGGLKVIQTTRTFSIANQLAHSEMERLRSNAASLPEMIVPVRNVRQTMQTVVVVDSSRDPNDLGPTTNKIDYNGNLLDASDEILGPWQLLSGANVFRRIIGEGGPVPAPRTVGTQTGGLMSLQFAPIDFNLVSDNLKVYGADLIKHDGATAVGARVVDYEFYVENAEGTDAVEPTLYLPADTDRTYRVAFTAWIDSAGKVVRKQILSASVAVPATPGDFYDVALKDLSGDPANFIGAEYDSIRVAREFDRVASFSTNPYEYRLIDASLGLLLFNPLAHNYVEKRTSGERLPLRARVDYDVLDWRVIRDDFRVPSEYPNQYKLKLGDLMTSRRQAADDKPFRGIDVPVQVENATLGTTEKRDFLVVDLDTGGIYTPRSYSVDISAGIITFLDSDAVTDGIQASLILPGATAATPVNAEGRAVRALFMGFGEWAIQVQKAADNFNQVLVNPGAGEFYVGGSAAYFGTTPLSVGEGETRIYFPRMDAGSQVTVGQVWYEDGAGQLMSLQDQQFFVQSTPLDPVGLPYIDIRSIVPDAARFNFANYGYAARNIRGVSLSVRVVWNPAFLRLTGNIARNSDLYDEWARNYRRVMAEGYLGKEVLP